MESWLLQIGERLLPSCRSLGVQDLWLEREMVTIYLFNAQRVEQIATVIAKGGEKHVDGAHSSKGGPGIGVSMAHRDGEIAVRYLIEGKQPLFEDLAHL